jgi:outer membrane lipoprotein-sorting protein
MESAFYGPMQWKELFETISVVGKGKVHDEECTILELKPAQGASIRAYVSDKSGRILCRNLTKTSEGAGSAVTEVYSDFRDVDGVTIPFKIVQTAESKGASETTVTIKEVKFDVDLPGSTFGAAASN